MIELPLDTAGKDAARTPSFNPFDPFHQLCRPLVLRSRLWLECSVAIKTRQRIETVWLYKASPDGRNLSLACRRRNIKEPGIPGLAIYSSARCVFEASIPLKSQRYKAPARLSPSSPSAPCIDPSSPPPSSCTSLCCPPHRSSAPPPTSASCSSSPQPPTHPSPYEPPSFHLAPAPAPPPLPPANSPQSSSASPSTPPASAPATATSTPSTSPPPSAPPSPPPPQSRTWASASSRRRIRRHRLLSRHDLPPRQFDRVPHAPGRRRLALALL